MKPLHHYSVAVVPPLLQQARALLDRKEWAQAAAVLDQWESTVVAGPQPAEYPESCLLRARLAVETGSYREGVERGREVLAILQATAADDLLGDVHSVLGLAYLGLGDTKNARIHARDALAIYRRLNDDAGVIRASNELARVHFVRGEYDVAIDFLHDAVDIARRQRDSDKETMLLGNLGRVLLLLGRWAQAGEALTSAHARAAANGNRASVARNLLSLAYLGVLRHDFRAAASYLDAALTVIESANLARERAIYFEYSAWWQFGQRHWIAAKEAFRRALEIGRHLSDQNDLISQSLRGLAECEAALQDWPEALRLAQEGLSVAIAIGDRSEAGCLYRTVALAQAHLGEAADGEAALAKARECLVAVGDLYELARWETVHAEVAARIAPDDTGAPIAALEEAIRLSTQLGAAALANESRWQLVDAYRRAGQVERALACARTAASLDGPRVQDERVRETLVSLVDDCVSRSQSADNEFRLDGMPWTLSGPTHGAEGAGDELQQAVEFCRRRLNAARVLLLEVTSDGKRSGRVVAQSGSTDAFAQRVAAFAASAYQTDLPTDQPRYHWLVESEPRLAAHLTDEAGCVPASAISVPVDLGPQSSGLLYLDTAAGNGEGPPPAFGPRDLDFAVAFAEVVAWRSTRLRSEGLLRDVQRLRDQLGRECEFPSILTQNPVLRETLSRARLVVDSDVSVLLQGETGTGKDLLARAIHYSGNRRDRRFVSVNCAALPETLLESELFGVRRGAFTGADRDKVGLFEEADGGTFFLDEIGEMPLSIQVKLLRMLESKEVVRLGDTKPRPVNVRVISATNRDLSAEMERGAFRRDLYYRLTPLIFVLPPLRERREDIPLLIDHFLEGTASETGRPMRLSPETVRILCAYHWPGNVRELDNEIRKLALLTEPGVVVGPERLSRKFVQTVSDAEASAGHPLPERFSLYDHIAQIERQYIVRALADAGGIKKHAAARLGIPESTLRLKMRIYSLDSN